MIHQPVLKKEVVKYLSPEPNENFVDCTFGQGGHTFTILKKNKPKGKVLAIEQTPALVKEAKEKVEKKELQERLILANDNFVNLKEITTRKSFKPVSGVLMDLGFSMWHIKKSGFGFSFSRKEPLIMRYDGDPEKLTAKKIVNNWPEEEIARVIKKYGEERYVHKIAKAIVRERKNGEIRTADELGKIIKKAVPGRQKKRIHPATRTFQALRIAANRELENLKETLPQALEILEKNGRLVVISFHSLEDRIVKNFLRDNKDSLKILTKKPVRPGKRELRKNPSSRSAKLRAAAKL